MSAFNFFKEDIEFLLKEKTRLRGWYLKILSEEGRIAENLNFIFCSDAYLLKINKKYLNKNDYTDVIAFQYNLKSEPITGDIYISIPRIRENAAIFKTSPSAELKRVMAHGILHLLGYKDKTKKEKKIIREKENYYLNKF
ncbi:MAG: rRNA maturation RNase YbeY [Bacteroidales bacterium]|nr:rRNA maturation RNase YbeY [Bacteroidales bacterium]HNW72697.1 rRNA maturation RNase YbeY [Bacteroidales bacterium]HPS49233.1 rRNA maturation RNase YbeY [Bacteroidales bacterium]